MFRKGLLVFLMLGRTQTKMVPPEVILALVLKFFCTKFQKAVQNAIPYVNL